MGAVHLTETPILTRGGSALPDQRPLSGKTVLVTRARAQAGELVKALEGLGAEVIRFATIRIGDPPDPEALRDAIAGLAHFQWVVFTSVNGVDRFWSTLREIGGDARQFGGVRVCAIGPATARALVRRGIHPDVVPTEFVAEALVDALRRVADVAGARVLLPRADIARASLPEGLRALGAVVTEVAAYATLLDGANAPRIREQLQAGEIDLATFTASSTVRNFVRLVGSDLGGVKVASIGPITSGTAREFGLPVHLEAAEYTIPGLVAAIRQHYE